jgi:hypothetical protein
MGYQQEQDGLGCSAFSVECLQEQYGHLVLVDIPLRMVNNLIHLVLVDIPLRMLKNQTHLALVDIPLRMPYCRILIFHLFEELQKIIL